MSSEARMELLPGTLDLIVLRTLESLGPQHAYAIASRLEQVSHGRLCLNQGTLYPALVRLEQRGDIAGEWRKTETHRDARYYSLTRSGLRQLAAETRRWRRMAGLVEHLLSEGA